MTSRSLITLKTHLYGALCNAAHVCLFINNVT